MPDLTYFHCTIFKQCVLLSLKFGKLGSYIISNVHELASNEKKPTAISDRNVSAKYVQVNV